jgi:type VI secretion system protein ImpC
MGNDEMAAEIDLQRSGKAGETQELESFSSLLKQSFKPRNKEHESEVERAVSVLVNQALADQSLVKEDVLETIESMIAALDRKLSDQLNEVMHAPEFQKLESAWRGLKYPVFNSETDATLKIRVLNTSKDELRTMFKSYPGAKWDQSPLFQMLYTSEYSTLGGEPYGCVIGDFQFDQSPMDVSLLRDLGKIASAAHAPFFAAAGPALLDIENWNKMYTKRDLGKVQDTPEFAAFKSFRDSEDARYVALCLPRVLARLPYGAKTEPVEEFGFEEVTDGHNGEKYAWMSAAHAMATNINRAFKEYGWTIRIRGVASGGEVANLPAHIFPTDDGGVDMKCPTEVSIDDRREAELSKLGLLPLIHRKNTDKAAFIGAQSLYKPKKFVNEDDTASDNLSSRITYMFAVSRFAHYLKVMVRDMIGQTKEKDQLEMELQSWINKYVDPQPKVSDEITKARQPLAGASIKVEEDEENPGYYRTIIKLRPHYQLEGMDIGLSLVSKMEKK